MKTRDQPHPAETSLLADSPMVLRCLDSNSSRIKCNIQNFEGLNFRLPWCPLSHWKKSMAIRWFLSGHKTESNETGLVGPKWESSLEDCRGIEFPMSLASKWMDWVVCYLDSPGRQQWAESHEEAVDTNHTSLGSETLPNPFALEIPFSSSLKGEYQAIDICVPWAFLISNLCPSFKLWKTRTPSPYLIY